ncbi:MCE family protein [Actinocorallia sp. A-T 12471]|uniref:MCE family protein n=1 Tax=Actinocorallia sp. A-T 12471 TaxID=3089813 RepID=UPI0029D06AA4|nr:MCE family protein [Actinocorallia sp. A-T 12471]MDX6741480.1 MCE family protein [Actinocorallia sp. A-T 12471]
MRVKLLLGPVLLAVLALTGCSIQTLHATKGPLTLSADFTDAQNLVVGHSVKIADVTVGSVVKVELVGSGADYRARVEMSLKEGVNVPVGTRAEISVTSLLGENYVRLTPPAGGDLSQGPFLADHDRIADTSVTPGLEEIVGHAGPLVSALAAGDVPGIAKAASEGLGGRGEQMNRMIRDAAVFTQLFADHRGELADAVDDLAALGRSIAKEKGPLDRLPDRLAKATARLADDRDRILTALRSLSDLAKTVNDTVLLKHTDQMHDMITQLGPMLKTLASDKTRLGTLIASAQEFVYRMPRSVYNGQLLIYPVLKIDEPSGAKEPTGPTLPELVEMLRPVG